MLGVTSHSKVPLRLAAMAGFALSILSLVVAFVYLVLKLVWWDTFNLGLAPLVIGVYFFGAVQLFFIGMLGEYIGSIHTQVHKRPARGRAGADQLRHRRTQSQPRDPGIPRRRIVSAHAKATRAPTTITPIRRSAPGSARATTSATVTAAWA